MALHLENNQVTNDNADTLAAIIGDGDDFDEVASTSSKDPIIESITAKKTNVQSMEEMMNRGRTTQPKHANPGKSASPAKKAKSKSKSPVPSRSTSPEEAPEPEKKRASASRSKSPKKASKKRSVSRSSSPSASPEPKSSKKRPAKRASPSPVPKKSAKSSPLDMFASKKKAVVDLDAKKAKAERKKEVTEARKSMKDMEVCMSPKDCEILNKIIKSENFSITSEPVKDGVLFHIQHDDDPIVKEHFLSAIRCCKECLAQHGKCSANAGLTAYLKQEGCRTFCLTADLKIKCKKCFTQGKKCLFPVSDILDYAKARVNEEGEVVLESVFPYATRGYMLGDLTESEFNKSAPKSPKAKAVENLQMAKASTPKKQPAKAASKPEPKVASRPKAKAPKPEPRSKPAHRSEPDSAGFLESLCNCLQQINTLFKTVDRATSGKMKTLCQPSVNKKSKSLLQMSIELFKLCRAENAFRDSHFLYQFRLHCAMLKDIAFVLADDDQIHVQAFEESKATRNLVVLAVEELLEEEMSTLFLNKEIMQLQEDNLVSGDFDTIMTSVFAILTKALAAFVSSVTRFTLKGSLGLPDFVQFASHIAIN